MITWVSHLAELFYLFGKTVRLGRWRRGNSVRRSITRFARGVVSSSAHRSKGRLHPHQRPAAVGSAIASPCHTGAMVTPYGISLRNMFLHVVYEHRHFAACAAASNSFALDPKLRYIADANKHVPDCWVMVRTGLLVYARNLASFYCDERTTENNEIRRPNDLNLFLTDFEIVSTPNSPLNEYVDSISVHVNHITAWRDVDFRTEHEVDMFARQKGTAWGVTRQRHEWDNDTTVIIAAVDSALEHAANPTSATTPNNWCKAFASLREACNERQQDPSTQWPDDLTRPQLDQHLESLGIP